MREPGDEKVTSATRRVEVEDARVFRGAGRGPTPEEDAAAERARPFTRATVDAYRDMTFRGATQRGEGRLDR